MAFRQPLRDKFRRHGTLIQADPTQFYVEFGNVVRVDRFRYRCSRVVVKKELNH